MENGLPIVVSSDAHDPDWVGEFTLARELLIEHDFDEEQILNTSVEKFRAFIGM